jgi:hypothetical protein
VLNASRVFQAWTIVRCATAGCVHGAQVLRYACNPEGPEALNLLEDGLATWLTALRVASAPSPQLTDLFPLLAAAMHASTGASAMWTQCHHVVMSTGTRSPALALATLRHLSCAQRHQCDLLPGLCCCSDVRILR